MALSPVATSAVPVPAEAPTSAAHVTKAPAMFGAATVGTATLGTAPPEATPIASGINPDMATVAGARYWRERTGFPRPSTTMPTSR